MKNFSLLAICIGTALLSCSRSDLTELEGRTEVSIALAADGTVNTKSVSEDVFPEIGDFTVEIFKRPDNKRLYRDSYANSADKKIRLNGGTYKLVAFHGDSLATGFDKAYYQAIIPFSINKDDRSLTVSGTARMANVKIAVKYGDNLKEYYSDFIGSVETDKKNVTDTLSFAKDETRAGFIPAGNLTFKIFTKINGKWKYWKAPQTIAANANDFITINADTPDQDGKLIININIDRSTEDITKEWTVPAEDVATDTPSITFGKDLTSKSLDFLEGQDIDGATVSVQAKAGIEKANLKIQSEYLKSLGIPSEIDLVNPDPEVIRTLENIGVTCLKMTKGSRISGIDFSGMKDRLKYNPDNIFKGIFNIAVTDRNGEPATSGDFSLGIVKSEAVINISEGNAFARNLREFSASAVTGDAEKFSLQYKKADESVWSDAKEDRIEGNTLFYNRLDKLEPNTEYNLRTIYNGNTGNASSPVSIKTEEAAQVLNAGFEDWVTETITIKVAWSSNRKLDWYLPHKDASNSWWATTSKRSMPTSILATTSTTVKSWPTVAWSPDYAEGTKSAHIYSVNVGRFNTDLVASGTAYAGELFIGTADDSGNHSSDGHPFASRPDKFSFKYKYAPVDNETFYVKLEFKNASGTTIYSKESTGSASSEWKTYDIDIPWENLSEKVADIYICFKSTSTTGSPHISANSNLEVAGKTYAGHFGSSLFVDDLQLIYE